MHISLVEAVSNGVLLLLWSTQVGFVYLQLVAYSVAIYLDYGILLFLLNRFLGKITYFSHFYMQLSRIYDINSN